ncbi:MAG: polyprenyl synthetase family protein [Methylococcales bacterium]|nr:polyprenyl synthetase family protein [Methylococcales bacterium]
MFNNEIIRPELEAVGKHLDEASIKVAGPLGKLVKKQLAGGKRLRPVLTLLCGRLFGDNNRSLSQAAAALELLHYGTLVHDDLIDNSELRRGEAAIQAGFSAELAVLAGDFFLAESVAMIGRLKNPELLEILGETLSVICGSEIDQLQNRGDKTNLRADYFRRINAKTGRLFQACAEMGSAIAGAEKSERASLSEFSSLLGTSFQIRDDASDYTGKSVELGKPVGQDLAQGLLTLPAIIFAEKNAGQTLERQKIIDSGAVESALMEAGVIREKALAILRSFSDSPARRELEEFALIV